VVALTGNGQPPSAVAEDRGADGDRLSQVDQPASLFDVEFDEQADAAQCFLVAPTCSERLVACSMNHARRSVSAAEYTGRV
jgi:hypothetical protein